MPIYYSPWSSAPNGGAKYRLRLELTIASQNVSANQSVVAWALYIEKDRSWDGFYDYFADWSMSLNGSVVAGQTNVQNPTAPWTGWSRHLLGADRLTVTHNTDGDKSIAFAAAWSRPGGGPGLGWAPAPMAISSGASPMALTPIARATAPTVTPSPTFEGGVVTINLPRASGSFTHDVTWESGALSGSIGTGLGTSATWTVPSGVLDEFPGQNRAPIAITAVTKNGATVVGSKQVTLLVAAPPPAPSVTPPTPETQFDIRARVVEWDDAEGEWLPGRILPAQEITLADPSSATATCTITLSGLEAIDFPDYSVVDIDVTGDGQNWTYTNHRFVLTRVEEDDADPTETATYSGVEFVDFVLGFAYNQRDYDWGKTATSPGGMIRTAFDAAKARGWGARMLPNFGVNVTSLGEPWANPLVNRTFNAGTPISQMLDGLVTDGLVEYRTEYRDNAAWLILLNPGTGDSYANDGSSPIVNLATAPLTRAPRRGSNEKRLTRVTVSGDAASTDKSDDRVQVTRERSPYDADVFGHMEGWVSASGVTSKAQAGTIGDNALRDNAAAVNERTFEYNAQDAPAWLHPYVVFRPGDWVLTPGDDATPIITDRISQITISKRADGTSFTILTGDRILSGTASLAKRQAAQTGGSIAGGTGGTPATLDSRIPAAPVIDESVSEGYWTTDGTARSQITLSWAAVTEAINGADITVDLYEVWWRPAVGEQWQLRTVTSETVAEMPDWDVLQAVELRVRARSVAGVFGEFSVDTAHTTLAPAVDLDGPIISDLYTDGVGSIYIVWDGALGADPAPARMAYVGAEVSSDGGATYVPMGTPIAAAGTIIVNPNAWGEFMVRLRAYDRLGNPGDASDPQTISLSDPHIDPAAPLAPTDLAAVAGAGWDASGFLPEAWFDLTWTGPTVDDDGEPVDIAGYDVYGLREGETDERFITSTRTEGVRISVGNGETWSFRVRAVSSYGATSAFSDSVTEVADATIPAADAPDAPTLSQYAGILRIRWSGNGMQPSTKYAYATISTSPTGTFTRAGMPLTGAGEVVLPGLAPGDTYYAKIVLVDELGQTSTSAASAGLLLQPITGVTIQTSPIANTGIKMTDAALTAYDVSGNPTFILDATTGAVWIAPYDAVFELGADGIEAETGDPTTGIAISSEGSSFNTFIHPSGVQIRNDQTPLSWWEADASDASLVNFVSPRARIDQRLRVGDYEFLREAKPVGSRLVIRYQGD